MTAQESSKFCVGLRYTTMPGWTAYATYVANLLTAIHSLDQEIEIAVVLDGNEKNSIPFLHLINREVRLPNPFFLTSLPSGTMGKVLQNMWSLFVEPFLTNGVSNKQGINAVLAHSKFVPAKIHRIPWISWIPDFQHLHLPEMFLKKEIRDRNKGFRKIAQNADCVILSSQDCYKDFKKSIPEHVSKVRVVPFVAQIPEKVYDQDPINICKVYNLPEKFIFLPNQFWKHKNHRVVIEALAKLHQSNPEIVVVCSGGVGDYRSQEYFALLLNEISKFNVRNNFIMLGMVPYEHVLLLIRQSCAVLQPSLFEGWSTTVEETKSLGKRVILSDILVHREQNPAGGIFFNSHDPVELAASLVKVYKKTSPGPDIEMENNARAELLERTKEFGRNILEAFKFVEELKR